MKGHVEIIKEKLPIEQVIGSYIRLEPNGSGFKARCPFHMEKTPSFSITPEKGMFYCYGCQKGGDIFTFVEEIEKITFREALEKLARDAGVDITDTHNSSVSVNNSKKLFDITSTTMRFYHTCLRQSAHAVQYLESRGMTRETMKQFFIGYSPGFNQVMTVLQKKFSNQDIISSGVGISGSRGVFDRFARRITFPILDHQGRVVGFSARILPGDPKEGAVGKYINSPETDIYHKSKVLFGYYQAKKTILQKKYVVLVEGNMDVVMLHQAGFSESVGVSGTACTQEHIALIARVTDHIVFAFDQDGPGIAALHKTALLALKNSLRVSVVRYTEKDPAEVLEKSAELWGQYIEARIDYFDYLLQKSQGYTDTHQRMSFVNTFVFPALNAISQKTLQQTLLETFARGLSWSIDNIAQDFKKFQALLPEHEFSINTNTLSQKESPTLSPIERILREIVILRELYPEITSNYQIEEPIVFPNIADIPQQERALLVSRIQSLDTTQKVGYIDRLYENVQILLIEYQYYKIIDEIRSIEYDPHQSNTYQEKLLLSQDLLARIHTLRSRIHQL